MAPRGDAKAAGTGSASLQGVAHGIVSQKGDCKGIIQLRIVKGLSNSHFSPVFKDLMQG